MEARSPNEALRDLLRTLPLDRVQLAMLEKGAMNMSPEEARKTLHYFTNTLPASLEKIRIAAKAVKEEQEERGE